VLVTVDTQIVDHMRGCLEMGSADFYVETIDFVIRLNSTPPAVVPVIIPCNVKWCTAHRMLSHISLREQDSAMEAAV